MRFNKILGSFLLALVFLGIVTNVSAQTSPKVNPVVWKTEMVSFSSSNFYIKIDDKYFYGNDSVFVDSDPNPNLTTLE